MSVFFEGYGVAGRRFTHGSGSSSAVTVADAELPDSTADKRLFRGGAEFAVVNVKVAGSEGDGAEVEVYTYDEALQEFVETGESMSVTLGNGESSKAQGRYFRVSSQAWAVFLKSLAGSPEVWVTGVPANLGGPQ